MVQSPGQPAGELQPLDLRRGLHRLSRGLVAYGVIGIVKRVTWWPQLMMGFTFGFGALVWVNGRIGGLRTEVTTTIGQIAVTTGDTATALSDASNTAQTFSSTLGQAANALPAMSDRINGLQDSLTSLEATLRSVNILGASPLGGAADSVAKMAARPIRDDL